MKIGVSLLAFDVRSGGQPIYQKNLPEDLLERIALKLMAQQYVKVETGQITESIIPLPQENSVIFSVVFTHQSVNYALFVVFDVAEQLLLYKIASKLSAKTKSLIDELSASDELHITPKTEAALTELGNEHALKLMAQQETQIQLTTAAGVKPSLKYVLSNLKKADQLFEALVVGQQVVCIVEDQGIADLVLTTLDVFTPHRDMVQSRWQLFYNPKADLLIGPPELLESVPKEVIVADFTNGSVSNGFSNPLVTDTIERFVGLEPEDLARSVNLFINYVIERTNALITTAQLPKDELLKSRTKVDALKKEVKKEEWMLLVRFLSQQHPIFHKRLCEALVVGDERYLTYLKVINKSGLPAKSVIDEIFEELGQSPDFVEPVVQPMVEKKLVALFNTELDPKTAERSQKTLEKELAGLEKKIAKSDYVFG